MVLTPILASKLRKVIFSEYEPENSSGVLWGRPTTSGDYTFYVFNNGEWEPVSTGGLAEIIIMLGEEIYRSKGGIVSLPAYPTTLPASDVYEWAKQELKPIYDLDEVADGLSRTLPTKISDLPNDVGYTTNDGTVTGLKLGDTSYLPSSGIVSLPAYPTTLPASDVYEWAKQSTKPSYSYSEISNTPTLATVATSGSYNDLLNKPTIPDAQIQSDWNQTTDTAKDYIKNKPTSLPASDVYSWAKAESKPTYAYSEITNTPTLATVATSGSYNDLSNKPTIPTALSDLTDDSTHRLVTDTKIGHWDAVYGVVPSAAYNVGNELADKSFVNSSIATATADYKGNYNLVNDLSLTTAATHSDIQTALASKISGADNNDYCFVEIPTADVTPTQIARVERYKYNGTSWAYEYTLNNSSFTANQWATINSGLVASDKTKLNDIESGAQVNTIESISIGGVSQTITAKNVDLPAYPASMVVLSYGSSTWAEFLAAYQANAIVYCRASSNANPGTGTQSRMAFMAYVNNATTPTEVEFQYYRSINAHSISQQGDQVFVYKLTSSGTWSVVTREASSKVVAGTNMSGSYSNGVLTLDCTGGSANMNTASISGTTLSAQVNTYYNASDVVNTLAVTLPAISDTTKTQSIVLHFTAGTTPNITFTSADNKTISYYNGYDIEAGLEYELNVLFDGTGWIVAFGVVGGTYQPIPVASASTLGGIKLGYSTSSKNYAVAVDLNNKAYVNVPWENTHRPIKVNGTQVLGDNTTALDLVAGSNVTLSESSGVVTISASGGGGGGTTMDSTTFSGTTLSAAVNTYYRASSSVGTLAVTLPSVSGTECKSIIINLTTSSSPNITFTSADSKTISYYSSYNIEASKEYEINIIYNGAKWIIASAEIS